MLIALTNRLNNNISTTIISAATVSIALDYHATDTANTLLNLHIRIHGKIVELALIKLTGNIPELTRTTPHIAAYYTGPKKANIQKCLI